MEFFVYCFVESCTAIGKTGYNRVARDNGRIYVIGK